MTGSRKQHAETSSLSENNGHSAKGRSLRKTHASDISTSYITISSRDHTMMQCRPGYQDFTSPKQNHAQDARQHGCGSEEALPLCLGL